MKVYIAGPMTGIEDYNYPAFHEAAREWRAAGYDVINPAENHDGDTSLPLAEYFKIDLPQVCDADAVVVLPGWQESRGASLEVMLAQHLGKPILNVDTFEPIEETILEEAQRYVYGDRQASYGHPIEDFTRTGRIWGAILGIPDIPPEKVGLCMAGVKMSRYVNKAKRDSLVDLAGYAATVALVEEAQR